MENCIFCRIIKDELPSSKVYEDDNFLAFLDIQPVSHGHVLIIPKKHVVWMQEAEDEIVGPIFIIAKKLMIAMKEGLKCDYVQVSVGGTDVPHFHVHLIPRYFDDGLSPWPTKEYKEEEKSETARKIAQALARPEL